MAPEQTLDDVLSHYGVLGMKWGVRRTPAQLARARGKRKEKKKPVTMTTPSEDVKKANEAKQKITKKDGTTQLTNAELQLVVQRMNLENQYKNLNNKENQAKIKKGEERVKTIKATQKTVNEAIAFANSPTGRLIIKSIRDAVTPMNFTDIRI